ncbi:hypothetical protein DLREEDagrD3_11010 [Denitratisoma sp. agr-D3]
MSLTVAGYANSSASAAMAALQKTYALGEAAAQADSQGDSSTDGTRVSLSFTGRKLANSVENLGNDNALTTPTSATVQDLSAALADKIGNLFRDAGINNDQPVQFSVDGQGQVQVSGVDTATQRRVQNLLSQQPTLANDIRTLSAVGAQVQAQESLGGQTLGTAASGDAQQVAARYAALFSGMRPAAEMTINYGSNQVLLMADGKLWRGSIQAG